MEMAPITSSPRTVEEIFKDYSGRRAGIVQALTYDVDEFYALCDPAKKNLCLYGHPNESWEVTLPAEKIPPELPEPVLGINFARDGTNQRDWLPLVAIHSDYWLLSVAFYLGSRFNRNERNRLFSLINDLPTVYEVVAERKPVKDKPSVDSGSKSRLSTEVSCQICSLNTHKADRCPYIYSPCTIAGCYGIRRLAICTKTENLNRNFLKCQFADCFGFQWLDEAILHKNSKNSASSSSSNNHGCLQCGDLSHWKTQCLWTSSLCIRPGCLATKQVMTSKAEDSEGRKYLKCHKCQHFEWITDAIARVNRDKAMQMGTKDTQGTKKLSEVTIDEFCDRFVTQQSKK